MKKVVYSLIFLLFIFIGINGVSAKTLANVCYYKSDDELLNFLVKVYDNGTAQGILIRPYSKSEGFADERSYGTAWDVAGWTGTGCSNNLVFRINVDIFNANKLASIATNYVLANNEYRLFGYPYEEHKYNPNAFTSQVYECEYKPTNISSGVTFQVLIHPNGSLVYTFNGSGSYLLDKYIESNVSTYLTANDFPKKFMEKFNLTPGVCPDISATSTGGYRPNLTIKVGLEGIIKFDDKKSTPPKNGVGEVFTDENSYFIDLEAIPNENRPFVTLTFIKYNNKNFIKAKVGSNEVSPVEVKASSGSEFSFIVINPHGLSFSISKNQIDKLFETDANNRIIKKKVYANLKMGYYNGYGPRYELSTEDTGNTDILSGERYKELVCELYPYLNAPNTKYNGSYEIVGHRRINFDGCSGNYQGEDPEYHTSIALRNLGNYCNELYSIYNKYKNYQHIETRMDECIDFDIFYNNLVINGVVNNLGSDCPFISGALKEKIVWVLNLIKIAGPILAIGLGSIDFIKVIVSGEADKEMKKAGQSFLKRFIAAVLLFVIPIILAWAIDLIFEKPEFKDNPFCNTVDWSKIK